MERQVYDRMAEHDATHWWYRARREVLAAVIAHRVALPAGARILEIGCGTGHNLAMLGRFGAVDAIELDDAARTLAEARLGRPIRKAMLPALDGIDERYDMIALLDVLEHVEDDAGALGGIRSRLHGDGSLLLTVPQHPWLWSAHDVANHHQRRYTKPALRHVIEGAGFEVKLLTSFNSLLFPAAVAARLASRLTGRDGDDDKPPPGPLNRLFDLVFGLERYLVGRVPMPPGVSLLAVASPR